MDYSAVGQTAHLAARMEQMAMPGSILVTAETLRLAEGWVQVRALGPVPVRGLAEPVEVFEVKRAGWCGLACKPPPRAASRGSSAATRRWGPPCRAGAGAGWPRADRGGRGRARRRQVAAVPRVPPVTSTHGWLTLESASVSYGKATAYLPVLELLRGYSGSSRGTTRAACARRCREKC